MSEDDDWGKLPTQAKVQHKSWKARMEGYDELLKIFSTEVDEKSSVFSTYLGMMKKFVVDPHASAQEKALDVVLSFMELAACAPKCANDVCPLILTKCLNSTRAKTKDKSIECLLMLIEIERQDVVLEELVKGLSNKNPKIVVGCLQTCREALNLFGPTVMQVKPLFKEFNRLFDDRSKDVRDETKNLVVEVFRWVGAITKDMLKDVKPLVLSELNEMFALVPPEKPVRARYLRSQRPKETKEDLAEPSGDGASAALNANSVSEQVNVEDLIEPVEILSKITNDYYGRIVDKQWKERRDALEMVEGLTNIPRIVPGDFSDFVKSLLHVVNKDTNVLLVTKAATVLSQLAKGLRTKFAPYSQQTIQACLSKFKERKPTVVEALRDAIDFASKAVSLDNFVEDVIAALGHKTPSVRAEAALFLGRTFKRCSSSVLNKKLLKMLIGPLCTTSVDTAPDVREASFAALGTAMFVVSEKNIQPFLGDLDPIRLAKVKDCCDQIVSEKGSDKSMQPTNAAAATTTTQSVKKETAPRRGAPPITRPSTAVNNDNGDGEGASSAATTDGGNKQTKTAVRKKASTASISSKSVQQNVEKSKPGVPTESMFTDDQVVQKATNLLGEDILRRLSDSARQERLQGLEDLQNKLTSITTSNYPTQILCRVILLKPGLKDTNIQVLKARIDCLNAILTSSSSVSSNLSEQLVPDLLEKIGDAKVGDAVKTTLFTLTEHTSFELIFGLVSTYLNETKNPKNQSEALNWLALGLKEFGVKGLAIQDVVKFLKANLSATNPAVRQGAITCVGVLHLFLGDNIRALFADEKPATVTLLNSEFVKNEGQKPPAPVRFTVTNKAISPTVDVDGETSDVDLDQPVSTEPDPESLLPRVDITDRLTSTIMTQLTSKAWKERAEALDNIKSIIAAVSLVDASGNKLQEVLTSLGKACGDVNKNLVKTVLTNLATFARIIPKVDIGNYLKCVVPGIIQCMGDSKVQVRESAVATLTAWHSKVSISLMFENDMLSDPLKAENPLLRTELIRWITTVISTLPPYSLRRSSPGLGENFVPQVFVCLEDRNPDARKQAQSILTPLIQQLGWDVVSKAANRLKPTSKDNILAMLEKARETVVPMQSNATVKKSDSSTKAVRSRSDSVKPEPPASNKVLENDDDPDPTTTSAKSEQKPTGAKKKQDAKKPPPSKKATEEQSVPNAILQANRTARSNRLSDEKKRKILKWDFDAPTREHIQQLNNLFAQAGTSSEFHALLFHTDFKQHIKAIDQLNHLLDTPEGDDATITNVDIILKWIVLRFFETNPVVLVKCLEYMTKLFTIMSESGNNLTEQECNAFLPYLVMKVGDPKDNVRQCIRNIFKIIVNIYPANKLFTFISNGVKAKTNKTRQECIDELGSLIERFGINVCQPTVPVALKLLSQQIGDRDNGVRSAALNSLVCAYAAIGEQLWKIVADLPEKDRSMLEERIRRSGRQPMSAPTESVERTMPPRPNTSRRDTIDQQRVMELNNRNDFVHPQQQNQSRQPLSAAHAKAREMLNEIGDISPEKAPSLPSLIQLDAEINELFKPIEVPTVKSQVRQPVLNALLRTSPDTVSAITMVVTTISSNDLTISCHALAEIDTVLRDERWYLLLNHVNQILMLITMQLRQVTARYFGDPSITQNQLVNLLRCHLATIDSLFSRSTLAREVSRETLRELVQILLHIVLDDKVTDLPDGDNVIRAMNTILLRIIESANGTRILSALIRLLHECVSSGHFTNRFTQSIMKSIWRITRSLSTAFNNYSLDVILLDCHHFFKAFPSTTWDTRKSDVPLRTIKTLLHILCGLQGPSILEFLDIIPNKEDSELESYLLNTLKTTSGLQTSSTPTKSAGSKSFVLSTTTRDKLADIFRKVGSKTPDEGLNELYDFTQMYPDVDVFTYLSNTSEFFQTYIKQALSNISIERARLTRGGNSCRQNNKQTTLQTNGVSIRPNRSFDFEMDGDGHLVNPKVLMHRLATLRRELGLGGIFTTNVDDLPGDEEIENRPCNNNTLGVAHGNNPDPNNIPVPGSKTPVENIQPESDARRIISASELSDIKRRLELIKSGQRF